MGTLGRDATAPFGVGVSVGVAEAEAVVLGVLLTALVGGVWPVGGGWETGALERIIVLLLATEREERLIPLCSPVETAGKGATADPATCRVEPGPEAAALPPTDEPVC